MRAYHCFGFGFPKKSQNLTYGFQPPTMLLVSFFHNRCIVRDPSDTSLNPNPKPLNPKPFEDCKGILVVTSEDSLGINLSNSQLSVEFHCRSP